jgi:selenocysteine-specific elongation factor
VYDYALVSCNSLKGIEELKELLVARMPEPKREVVENKSFSVLVDHCFSLSGKGVVLTGTVLSGKVKVGDMIELPSLSGSEMYKKV